MKVSLDIRVFNWLLSVDIKKSRIAEYEKAAYHAWDRYSIISIIRIVKQSIRLHS